MPIPLYLTLLAGCAALAGIAVSLSPWLLPKLIAIAISLTCLGILTDYQKESLSFPEGEFTNQSIRYLLKRLGVVISILIFIVLLLLIRFSLIWLFIAVTFLPLAIFLTYLSVAEREQDQTFIRGAELRELPFKNAKKLFTNSQKTSKK